MFVWVDDEIEENEEVTSNEVVQNDSNVVAIAVELMEETMKKKCKALKEVKCWEDEREIYEFFAICVSVYQPVFCSKVVCLGCKKMTLDELGSDSVVVWS